MAIRYKKLYKAWGLAINSLYTYVDQKKSVGVIVSFVDKTLPKAADKVPPEKVPFTYLAIKLCDMICFYRKPMMLLDNVILTAEK